MGGGVVTSCSLHFLLATCGICPVGFVLVRGQQKQTHLTGTYVKNRPHTEKPGKSFYPLPAEKKRLRTRHASYSARIELKRRPQVPDGLPGGMYITCYFGGAPYRGNVHGSPRHTTAISTAFHGQPRTIHGLPRTFHGLPRTYYGLPRNAAEHRGGP